MPSRSAQVLADHHAELHDAHHVVVIGVSPATTAAHKPFLSVRHMPLDFASDPEGRIAQAFGISAPREQLRMAVVDRSGAIRAVWHGGDPERHIRELVVAARE